MVVKKSSIEIVNRKVLPRSVRLFVYDSFKRGFRLNRYLRSSTFKCSTIVEGYTMYDVFHNFYPIVVKSNKGTVIGDIFSVPLSEFREVVIITGRHGLKPKLIKLHGADSVIFTANLKELEKDDSKDNMLGTLNEVKSGEWKIGKL